MSRKKIAIICGGPSAERGISLNSARSLFDNLDSTKYEVSLFYVNPQLKFFKISPAQIYSNTPLDFDYKLQGSKQELTKAGLKAALKKIDLVFPAIHGTFGEDGKLQKLLEEFHVPYLGSGVKGCQNSADKHLCQKILKKNGFYTVQDYVVKKGEKLPKLPPGSYVAKPLHGGSSIGVQYINASKELPQKIKKVFEVEKEVIIEPKVEGIEFTIIVLENQNNEPVALMPTEINFGKDVFFDYRKKYLATNETRYYTPARFHPQTIEAIRKQACQAFKCVGMKDFARIDGWILKNGAIWLSDINAISGMEQNSFLFQQAALLGLSHSQLLDYLISKKIENPLKKFPEITSPHQRETIPVIFGGNTAERQISVMSGTNVWMKLKSSKKYRPIPLFLSLSGKIYYIPQFLCLQHTVEEIEEKIKLLKEEKFFTNLKLEQAKILQELHIEEKSIEEQIFVPHQTSMKAIAQKYKFLFLGLHGGAGENGTFQASLDRLKLPYNGPGANASQLCMDKYLTGKIIEKAKIPDVSVAKKMLMKIEEKPEQVWKKLKSQYFSKSIILKPRADGCSAGVIRVNNIQEFKKVLKFFKSNARYISEKAIHPRHGRIELPSSKIQEIMIEEFIMTDKVDLKNLKINWKTLSNWIEITVGVLGSKENMTVMYPSQTIVEQEMLSLEEKFMGGTGINLAPPPQKFVSPRVVEKVRKHLKKIAKLLKIEGYSRIDCFMNRKNGKIIVIEANTLPALTPSTTFFQQGLTLPQPLSPRELLEKIIEIGKKRFSKSF